MVLIPEAGGGVKHRTGMHCPEQVMDFLALKAVHSPIFTSYTGYRCFRNTAGSDISTRPPTHSSKSPLTAMI
jgi:hypothetical protein